MIRVSSSRKRGYGKGNRGGLRLRQLLKNVDVSGDETVLSHDLHRIPVTFQDYETLASQLELSLDWLVGIGNSAHGQDFRFPAG